MIAHGAFEIAASSRALVDPFFDAVLVKGVAASVLGNQADRVFDVNALLHALGVQETLADPADLLVQFPGPYSEAIEGFQLQLGVGILVHEINIIIIIFSISS